MGESSMAILSRVEKAVKYRSELNLSGADRISKEAGDFITKICTKKRYSTRSKIRLTEIACSIADLVQERNISEAHILEAMQYRERPWGVSANNRNK
ncbi:hypothetical protein EB052_01640 [bacterium]|nr:hypothetical protein [bacterium]